MGSLVKRGNGLAQIPSRDSFFEPFGNLFDNFYDGFFNSLSPDSARDKSKFPRWDIYSTDKEWVVEVAVPGIEMKNIKVQVVESENTRTHGYDRMLRVSGSSSSENKVDKDASYYARELRRSSFERSVYLPNEIEGDPTATMKNGVLKISWPAPKSKPVVDNSKDIEIKCLDP